ncbi:3'(2'),5'-bisphosphate nucleotidase CysQ [Pontiellaceae bacterium B12227]|nr:3'(2'),5'-bisphosphate nucleotidase CysQ [Pontiellaceae bacterium B12227]
MIRLAIKAALQAGESILHVYDQEFEVEFKADESPLTAADKASHDIIVQALETTPYPVLSEESVSIDYKEREDWITYWLVDPLDGTKEFIKRNGEFTVNIALIKKGIPVFGVVYVPVTGTLYFGDQNGAYKAVLGEHFQSMEDLIEQLPDVGNFQRLEIMGAPESPLRVVASKSHCNNETQQFIADLGEKYGETELVSRGSSLKLCMVAEGSADIYPRIAPTMEWDTAAAHAVVKAAGGKVFRFDSAVAPADYICSNDRIEELFYNKENLLNSFFVVSGIGA